MVADHWFRQIEKVLEAMDITFDAAKIRLTAFQLEGESQVWWDWVKTFTDLEAMTWAEFHGLFMSKYFCDTPKPGGLVDHRQPTETCVSHIMRPILE